MSADSVAVASVALVLAFFALMMFFCIVGSFFLICGFVWFSSGGSNSSVGEHSSSWWYSWRFWIPGNSHSSVNPEKNIANDEPKASDASVSQAKEISDLKEEIASLKSKASSSESTIANIEGQLITSLQAQLDTLKNVLESKLVDLKGENAALQEDLSSTKKALRELQDKERNSSDSLKKVNRFVTFLKNRIVEVSNFLQEYDPCVITFQVGKLKDDLNNFKSDVYNLESSVNKIGIHLGENFLDITN
jgi:peptidoglycan hydrolase CwlO-like protein